MHYHVVVLTEEANPHKEAIAAAMAPHKENGDAGGYWDWYRIGGRWDGSLYPERADDHECSDDCHYSTRHEDIASNTRSVADIPEGTEKLIAAIVTPDGAWLEGEVAYRHPDFKGWDRRDEYRALADRLESEWRSQVRRILVEHNACTAVSVDIHS